MSSHRLHSLSTPTLQVPPFHYGGLSDGRQATPPPMESPLPCTPRPNRFVEPPRTPLAKFMTSFGESSDGGAANLAAGIEIIRPSSSCSTYSNSSSSSMDSATTYTSAGGSCTSVEDNEDYSYLTPLNKGTNRDADFVTSAISVTLPVPEHTRVKRRERSGRVRKTHWTEDMDAHLWRTYSLYQNDPKTTPFFVLPGQVPPLGVCYKVAREVKRSWKDAKLSGEWQSSGATTPRPKARRAVEPASEASNRADSLRKISPFTFPASESSTRRRLRELCRYNYVQTTNPHNLRQQRSIKSRSSTKSPSPIKTSQMKRPNARDAFASTRSMALSLTTSTASSMRPSGALAALASGHDITPTSQHFGEALAGVNSISNVPSLQPTVANKRPSSLQESVFDIESPSKGIRSSHRRAQSSTLDSKAIPSLLPALELKSSKSPYGTWPRRLKRADLGDEEGESSTPLTSRRIRRGNLSGLFEDAFTPALSTGANKRLRGHTISAGTNPFSTRRRQRPSAPLLTVTGPISYENNGEVQSPLAKRDTPGRFTQDLNLNHLPKRLGSPFMERLLGKKSAKTSES